MPEKRFNYDNAIFPAWKLFGPDKTRVCASIHVPVTEDSCMIYSEVPTLSGQAVTRLNPGDTLFLSALEGHDMTKPWYISSNTVGTNYVYVYEEFLDYTVFEILKAKGIESTQGLPLLLLGLLAVGSS